jgi:large subunit ribosomal protein L23
MGLFDKLTGKAQPEAEDKKKAHKSSKPAKGKKEDNVLNMVKEGEAKTAAPVKLKENTGRAHQVLKQYHLSEKTNQLSSIGRYVFVVDGKTNKIEVKKAVEAVYDVHVVSVNILNTKGKSRRYGKTSGRTSDWKKAIVTLKAGEKISGLAEGV